MTKLERALQLKLLTEAADIYPHFVDVKRSWPDDENHSISVNLFYLHEHQLMEVHWSDMLSGERPIHQAKITARGLDFLADDGGLSAILGVVTIKLHEDTIKALLIEQVQKSSAPPSVKSKLIEQLKALPADATKSLTLEALKSGVSHIPDIATWIQTLPDLLG